MSLNPDSHHAADNVQPATVAGPQLLRHRLRGRFAALSVVGMLMVALPLVQVLQYQTAEVQNLAAERAGLDPVARAVDVQRSLLAHADAAAAVLRGDMALEPLRQQRQGAVDAHVRALAVVLANGAWDRAVRESDALREDWSLLARQVAQHSVSAPESEQGHRLLVEQTLQVVDLVADATLPRTGTDSSLDSTGSAVAQQDDMGIARLAHLPSTRAGDDTAATLAAAHALPRLAWRLALLARPAPERSAAAQQRDMADAEASLARALGAMNRAADNLRSAEAKQLLARATANAGAAADSYFSLLHAASHTPPLHLQAAALAVADAQLLLFQLARDSVDQRLLQQLDAAELRRNLFVSTMAVLALLALALVSSLARRLQRWQAQALQAQTLVAPVAAAMPQGASHGAEARHLLQRLRVSDPRARPARPGQHSDAQPTLPPAL